MSFFHDEQSASFYDEYDQGDDSRRGNYERWTPSTHQYNVKELYETDKARLFELNESPSSSIINSVKSQMEAAGLLYYPNNVTLRAWVAKSMIMKYEGTMLKSKVRLTGFTCYKGKSVTDILKEAENGKEN